MTPRMLGLTVPASRMGSKTLLSSNNYYERRCYCGRTQDLSIQSKAAGGMDWRDRLRLGIITKLKANFPDDVGASRARYLFLFWKQVNKMDLAGVPKKNLIGVMANMEIAEMYFIELVSFFDFLHHFGEADKTVNCGESNDEKKWCQHGHGS
ncbi:hypothetical protein ABKN59_008172 [Abortiporus biennis]